MIFLGYLPRRSSPAGIFVRLKEHQRICIWCRQSIQNRSVHADNKKQQPISVATPLVFTPKSSSKHSIFSLKGTASILEPKWAHLSPCVGAAISTSPVIRNLIKLASRYPPENDNPIESKKSVYHQSLLQTATLANQVFFQIMPESSLFLARTKSMPAAYLTPQLIGAIVGRSILAKDIDDKAVREYLLNEFDMRSNKIGNLWTGVSLNRWMDLFRLSHHHDATNLDWMPLSVWAVALWELSHSEEINLSPQESWLEYLLECDTHVQQLCLESIFRKDNDLAQGLKRRDPVAMKEWKEQVFSPSKDLGGTNTEESMDTLLEIWEGNSEGTLRLDRLNEEDWTRASLALEVVCASTALGQASFDYDSSALSLEDTNIPKLSDKPVVPNGYFSVDKGDLKAGR